MSTHNICFHGEIKKLINSFGLRKDPYLELYKHGHEIVPYHVFYEGTVSPDKVIIAMII